MGRVHAVWWLAAADLRAGGRVLCGLAAVIAVGGGLTLALLAGAERTDTAYSRLVEEQQPYQAFVFDGGFVGEADVPADFLDRVAALPEVVEAGRFSTVFDEGGRTDAGEVIGEPDYLQTMVAVDEQAVALVERQKVLEGRHADRDAPDEVSVNFTVAERYGLEPGDRFTLELFRPAELLAAPGDEAPTPVPYELHVVGVVASAGDFPPRSLGDGAGTVNLTPAFASENPSLVSEQQVLAARLGDLDGGAVGFARGVERAAGGDVGFDALGSLAAAEQHDATARAIRPLSSALWVLGALSALAVALVAAPAVLRATTPAPDRRAALRSMGFTSRSILSVQVLQALAVGAAGVAIAVIVAVALSDRFPLGLAAVAEPDPGFRVDVGTLAVGCAALLGFLVLLVGLGGWWSTRVAMRNRQTGTVLGRLRRVVVRPWAPPSMSVGVHLAMEPGRGATSTPARPTMVGAVAAVSALVAALVLAAGVDHLISTPRLYGWNWDLSIGDGYGDDAGPEVVDALRSHPDISAAAAGTFAELEADGRPLYVVGLDPIRGQLGPTVIDGRAPAAEGEILLGSSTMSDLGVELGDEVAVRFRRTIEGGVVEDPPTVPLEVVGEGVLPAQSDIGLSDGGALTFSGLEALVPEVEVAQNFFPVRIEDGGDPDAVRADLAERVALYTVPTQRPTDLVNFARVDRLPVLGATVFAVMALAMLAHLLLASVRQRRRDLAVLRALGDTKAQLSATIAWQAVAVVALALAVGVPLGIAAGRAATTVLAERLGVVAEPVVPGVLWLVVPGTLVVAVMIASVPARLASRRAPGVVLRES